MSDVHFTETPEFKLAVAKQAADQMAAAVREAVAAAIPDIRASLLAEMRSSKEEIHLKPILGDKHSGEQFAQNLAVAIAQLADQGTGMGKRVAPEVLAHRQSERERLQGLILDMRRGVHERKNDAAAVYKLRHKVYLDEMMIDPVFKRTKESATEPTEIVWLGIPNEAMVPVNDSAKAIYEAFQGSIGHIATPAAELPSYLTDSGVVVNGTRAPTRRQPHMMNALAIEGEHQSFGEGVAVRGRQNGPNSLQHILGTVHPPAMGQI